MVEKPGVEAVVRDIKRRTRRKYSSEEKIRIVLEGLRGEMSIAELCRKEGIQENVYYHEVMASPQVEQGLSGSGEETASRGHGQGGHQR